MSCDKFCSGVHLIKVNNTAYFTNDFSHILFNSSRQWIRCTLCKKKVDLTTLGFDDLESNVYIQFSDESLVDDSKCDSCKHEPPSCRCSDCKTNLCNDCAAEHLNTLIETNHTIVKVTEGMVGKGSWEAVCEIHNPFTLELFCVTCSVPICGRCALDKHLSHVTEDVNACANEKRRRLKALMNDNLTKRMLRESREHLTANRKDRTHLALDVAKVTGQIKQFMETQKAEIDSMGKRLIAELKEKEEACLSSLDRRYQEAEYRQRSAEQVLTTTKRIIERTRDVDFLRRYADLHTVVQKAKKHSQVVQQNVGCEFIPLLKLGSLGRVKLNVRLKKTIDFYDIGKASFQKRISCICPTSDSNAWIAYRKTIQLCYKDGLLGTQIELDDIIISMAENSYETLFIACKTAIKVLGSKLVQKTSFHLSHEPSSIAFTDDDSLVICYKDARRVSIHSMNGKVIREMDVRHFGYRFGARITDPWRVAINDDQDILIADCSSENIAIFDSQGEIKSSFRCNVFRKAILCCDQGLVYVADQKRDYINIFSETGQLLQSIRAEGISGLWSMSIDKTGNLWLGSWNGAVKIYGRT